MVFTPEFNLEGRIRQVFEQARNSSRAQTPEPASIYGFSMSFSDDGTPIIEEFGNASPYGTSDYVEPVTDVVEKYDTVCVLAELPGVEKEDIELRASDSQVTIKVDKPLRRFIKDIRLSCMVNPQTATAKYTNGVLEVTLRRAENIESGEKISIN
jgi:HSP20 family protein